ncbi:MAG: MBL fold metallo-hydrolase [Pseudidiomarina maritima]|nr:MBL fold metallo-hydrolase [Pseudidiomarina maritima]
MKHSLKTLIMASALIATTACTGVGDTTQQQTTTTTTKVSVQHIRNATVKITYGETTFLVDPMLAGKGAYPGFEGTYNSHLRNPLVDLPMPTEQLLANVDAVIVTHTHLDHWDDAAQQVIPKALPLFVQNEADAKTVRDQGFTDVRVLDQSAEFAGVTLQKTGGQHGEDSVYAVPPVAQMLSEVMGVLFSAPNAKQVYLAGDTVWRPEVEQVLKAEQPEVIILNTGAAVINGFEQAPILMGTSDTLRVHQMLPNATIVAVHMDAVNHMTVSRADLQQFVDTQEISAAVRIPADGETLSF